MQIDAPSDVQIFSLNPLKRGKDNNYHKLEIPVALNKGGTALSAAKEDFCSKRVDKFSANANCQVEFSYAHGKTQVIASLYGPSEAKFGSK